MNLKQFNTLHQQTEPLLICNVWDVASAKTAEKLDFKAIGTSSAAIASLLGYPDGEQMPFEEMLYIVKRIATSTHLPLTVDLEAGYSQDPLVTASFISALSQAGVVGINLEDSKVNRTRTLVNADTFADYLSRIKAQLVQNHIDMFINVRTDTFVLGEQDARSETQKRARLYEAAGADGIFVPCITQIDDIAAIVSATALPINVMCMPNLPDFGTLSRLGVKRISMGNFLFDKIQDEFIACLNHIRKDNSFHAIF